MKASRTKWLFIVAWVLLVIGSPVLAQKADDEKKQDKSSEQEQQTEQEPEIKDEELKIFIDRIDIIGELEKPQAVFIIPGKNPEIDDIRIQRSFFNNIFRKVERKGKIITKIQTEPSKERKDYIPW